MQKNQVTAPRIVSLPSKKMIGVSMSMSYTNNKTPELWRSFMTQRKKIQNVVGKDLYSLQIYTPAFDIEKFNPDALYQKWALTEVSDFNYIPEGFEQFTLDAGTYAVFIHKGLPSDFAKTIDLIFYQWLPASDYALDDRPHFEVLGEKYIRDSPISEEEIWIPIKKK
jgi:AraC family transcriptional regulator